MHLLDKIRCMIGTPRSYFPRQQPAVSGSFDVAGFQGGEAMLQMGNVGHTGHIQCIRPS
jgi:hypothetical protein